MNFHGLEFRPPFIRVKTVEHFFLFRATFMTKI